jgi:hypothetical protein
MQHPLQQLPMSAFLPAVAVEPRTPRQLQEIARREGVTVAALVRSILAGYADGYLACVGTRA